MTLSAKLPIGLHRHVANGLYERLLEIRHPNPISFLQHGLLASILPDHTHSASPPLQLTKLQLVDLPDTLAPHTPLRLTFWQRLRGQHLLTEVIETERWLGSSSSYSADVLTSLLVFHQHDAKHLLSRYFSSVAINGCLLGAAFGPDTLSVCRAAWQDVGIALAPSNIPDMHDLGDLLSQVGFDDVVVESDTYTIIYNDVELLLSDIKQLNASEEFFAASTYKGLITPRLWHRFKAALAERLHDDSLVRFEVVGFHGWRFASSAPQGRSFDNGHEAVIPISNIQKVSK